MDPTALPDLVELASQSPRALRMGIGVLGAILCFAGARFYRTALWLAPFAAGATLTGAGFAWAGQTIPLLHQPFVLGGGALVGGAVAMHLTQLAHGLALMLVGALAGLTIGAAVAQELAATRPMPWLPIGATIVGGLGFPPLFELLLRGLTAAVGAVLIVWAAGMPTNLTWIVVLTLSGGVVQLFVGLGDDEFSF